MFIFCVFLLSDYGFSSEESNVFYFYHHFLHLRYDTMLGAMSVIYKYWFTDII